ncbi:MAG TPA: antibiotic biosynthesis monooxygenase [Bacillota bacterium]|nr:antibiotic biosynthesis monooxygenase [Bacillota bacterium]
MDQMIASEIVEFKLVPGISDEDFIKRVEFLEAQFHSKQSGFIDTELAKGQDGKWVMIQHWKSMAELKVVVKLMMKEPLTESFRMALDPTSVKMQLLQQVKTW